MADDSKIAIILGCTLGGAAMIFIVVLILVCICSRRSSRGEENKVKTISEVNESHFSIQRSGLPPVQQSQFIRHGSQQWKGHSSLTSAPPGGDFISQKQAPDLMGQQNLTGQQSHIVPWYMRTLGRAKHFIQNRQIANQSKRDSGEQLVESRYTGTSADIPGSSSSTNVINKRLQIPRVDKQSVNQLNSPAIHSNVQRGSQTDLLPNDYMADTRNYPAQFSYINQAYYKSREHSNPAETGSNPYQLEPQVAASRQNYIHQQQFKSDNLNRGSEQYLNQKWNDLTGETSTLSLPRPTIITREDPTTPAGQERVEPVLPPSGKHPTRPDTPQFDPQRKNGANPAKHQHKSNQHLPPASNQQPRYTNQASSSSEEKKIGDAFKFLDEID